MRIGDVLEWIAALLLALAIYRLFGVTGALITGAVFLMYEAQCYSDKPLPKLRRKK